MTTTSTLLPGYTWHNGMLRQATLIEENKSQLSDTQTQTEDTFGYKWKRRETYESEAMNSYIRSWLVERYCQDSQNVEDFRQSLAGKRILDAGCGSGNSALLLFGENALKASQYLGVDISQAADVAKQRFAERGVPGEFIQGSVSELPIELGQFDIVFSEGVLHHTDNTRQAVLHLGQFLKPGGLLMFYVYRKKSPLREYTDDYIRDRLAPMSNDEAWDALMPLTKLGRQLGELNIEFNIEEPVDILGIPAGKIDLQRFFYWHICKAYYRPEYALDEMNHINFDWYRPFNCHRHTVEEVQGWVQELGLSIQKLDVQDAGITVVAQK